MNRGTYVDPAAGKLRFAQFAETWMAGLGHLKASAALRYREVACTHVIPQWGPWQLAKVARSDIAAWIGDLVASGPVARSGPQGLLGYVDDLRGRSRGPPHRHQPGQGRATPEADAHRPPVLSSTELSRLVEAARGHGLEVLLLGLTGIRFGELSALKVKRVDPVAGQARHRRERHRRRLQARLVDT